MKIQVIFLILLFPFVNKAIEHDAMFGGDAKSAALGNASVSNIDVWACFNNQGALAFTKKPQFALSYMNRYALKELSTVSMGVSYPLKSGVASVQFQAFGSSLFAVYKSGFGYSRAFGERIGVGLHFDLLSTKMNPNEPMMHVATFEMGLLALLNEKLSLGFHVFNPPAVQYDLTFYREQLSVVARMGFNYSISESINLSAEIIGDNVELPGGRMGIQYQLEDAFFLRLGFQTKGAALGAGLGYKIKSAMLDFSCQSVQNIGRVYAISLSYYLR